MRILRSHARPFAPSRLGAVGSLALLLSSTKSFAQTEAQKPPPNVLLLVDSSGSMEFKTNGVAPNCVPGDSAASEKSRWTNLVEVLTGTFNNYSCLTQDRSSAAFKSEFSINGATPYDYGYVNPYHRALADLCTYGPGVVPTTPYEWPPGAVNKFPVVGSTVSRPGAASLPTYTGCTFSQSNDGLLDTYKNMIRFGLMTFDARVSAETGVDGVTSKWSEGFDGNWSYYLGTGVTGHPADCKDPTPQEVGARNAAAPPWEGRMVAFGPPNDLTGMATRNAWIQEVLLSTRPYGATPIAGMLDDARAFLFSDTNPDPLNTGEEFGPVNDPNWLASNCRKTVVILLTDGEPNLDLRPYCTQTGAPDGVCPYQTPEEIVESLRSSAPQTSQQVETYVIGFALASWRPAGKTEDVTCATVPVNEVCADPSKEAQACCTMNKIAAAGGFDQAGAPRRAFFASSAADLKNVFTNILDDVIQVATRTMPVYSGSGGDTTSKGYKFFSAFDPQPDPTTSQLWEGLLQRKRFVCSKDLVPELKYEPDEGDDFAANLNSQSGPPRQFYTVIGSASQKSMRPYIETDTDGVGTDSGTQTDVMAAGGLSAEISAAAMGVSAADCDGATSADSCRDRILKHLVGLPNGIPDETRCPASGCRLFGGIYHSVPTAVPGRPAELLRDESYEAFAKEMAEIARPSVLYTSTVDGFVHAFDLAPFPGSEDAAERAVDSEENNELWAFIPPAVLPKLKLQYPNSQKVLLDGVPIIKDVVATKTGEGDEAVLSGYERLVSDAQAGTGFWRTVMVQSFGEGVIDGGYFALDITEPDRQTDQKPTFRWQLTHDKSDQPLFGLGGTPLITTLFINDGDDVPHEVAVAVLPGGDVVGGSSGTTTTPATMVMDAKPDGFKTTRDVRAYPGAQSARSLTIVRLDNGEIIRTFRPDAGTTTIKSDVLTPTDIPAPITGQPKAYPDLTGAVADRIFVGDREGRLWRVDVSSQNPEDWEMKIFYDAFEDETDVEKGQPVVLPPVISVDDVGEVTVAFATGSQEPDNTKNRVISLTERLDDDNDFYAQVNWIHKLDAGDRVTGPMVLFNSALYYSVSHPPATTGVSCDVGHSKVYGVHYIESADYADATEDGDEPDPTTGPGRIRKDKDIEIASEAGLVFGVSLEQEPTCAKAADTIEGNDSFGYGEVKMSTEINPGKFWLVFEASGNDKGGSATRGVYEERKELDSPRLAVSFQSWAVVYE